MADTVLVADKTVVSSKGDGPAVDIGGATNRVFLLTLDISDIIEQESLELSIFGSADGAAWDAKPLVTYPQEFYRGQYPLMLDLTAHPEVKCVRAHWDVARWGNAEVRVRPQHERNPARSLTPSASRGQDSSLTIAQSILSMDIESQMIVRPARNVSGSLSLPGDKSISHRYAMLAGIADGPSRLNNYST